MIAQLTEKQQAATHKRVDEWHAKLSGDADLKQKRREAEQSKKEAQHKQSYPHFRKKERQRLMQEFEKRTSLLKKKQPLPEIDHEVRQVRAKKMYIAAERVARKQQEQLKQMMTEFEQFKADEHVNRILQAYSATIKAVFDRYAKIGQPSTFYASDVGLLINYQGFNRFGSDFNMYPALLTQQDALQIFRHLTKDQTPIPGAPKGLSEAEFFDAFVRFAMKASEKLSPGESGVRAGELGGLGGLEATVNERREGSDRETEAPHEEEAEKFNRSEMHMEEAALERRRPRGSGRSSSRSRMEPREASITQSGLLMTNLFEWLGLPTDPKLATALLKELASRSVTYNPKEKKMMTQSTSHLITVKPAQLKRIRRGY